MTKRTNKPVTHALILIALLALGSGCDNNTGAPQKSLQAKKAGGEFSIIEVNAYQFMFNDKDPGSVIIFGSPEFRQCNLSFIKNNFKAGYHSRVETFDQADIDLTCLNEKAHFAMSPVAPTFIDMTVSELDDRHAVVDLSFSLYSIHTKQKMKRDHVTLVIDGDKLARLRVD